MSAQPVRGDIRYDDIGPRRVMAVADGYVMCRRPASMPHVMPIKKWLALRAEKDAPCG